MSARTVWRPGMGDTERDRMRASLNGELVPKISRELRESVEDFGLTIVAVPGGFAVADPDTGEILAKGTIARMEAFVVEWPQRDHLVGNMHMGEILAYFPGASMDDAVDVAKLELRAELARRPRPPLPPCTPGPLKLGVFRGGPLANQRHPVAEHGPAIVRAEVDGVVHYYSHRVRTARTYVYAGNWS